MMKDIKNFFNENNSVAVALSGGVDSAVLLLLAKRYAKEVKAYCVRSQFQPKSELDDAVKTSEIIGAKLEIIDVDVLSDSVIVSNPSDRCYYCKKRIFTAICEAAKRDGFDTVCDGTNATDDIEDRAGFRALCELGVLSPLRDCGYTKSKIRKTAQENALFIADKPSNACLATRIPTGTAITAELLNKTEAAENVLRNAGFSNFRVRYDNNLARLEISRNDRELFNESISEILLEYYDGVYLDEKVRTYE